MVQQEPDQITLTACREHPSPGPATFADQIRGMVQRDDPAEGLGVGAGLLVELEGSHPKAMVFGRGGEVGVTGPRVAEVNGSPDCKCPPRNTEVARPNECAAGPLL